MTRLIHVSALGIERAPESRYAATEIRRRAGGARGVPGGDHPAPGLLVGPEDGFFQRFARLGLILPFLPLIGGGHTRFSRCW